MHRERGTWRCGLPLAACLAIATSGWGCSTGAPPDDDDGAAAEERFQAVLGQVELVRVDANLMQSPAAEVPELVVSPQGMWIEGRAVRAHRAEHRGGVVEAGSGTYLGGSLQTHLAMPGVWNGRRFDDDGRLGLLLPMLHDLRVFYGTHPRRFVAGTRRMRRGILQSATGSDWSSCTDGMRSMGICDTSSLPRRVADNVLALFVDATTPMSSVIAVVRESRRAGYQYFDAVVETPVGGRAFTLTPPPAPPLYPGPEGECSEVTVTVALDRISLGVDQLGPASRRRPLYQRADLRSDDVRRRLRGILRAVPLGRPGCSRAVLEIEQGAGHRAWSEVAPTLAAVWESIGIDTFQLSLRPGGPHGQLATPF